MYTYFPNSPLSSTTFVGKEISAERVFDKSTLENDRQEDRGFKLTQEEDSVADASSGNNVNTPDLSGSSKDWEDISFLHLDWGPKKVVLFKAFWDDRETADGPIVRVAVTIESIINETDNTLQLPLYCYTSCSDTVEVHQLDHRVQKSGYLIPRYYFKGVPYEKFVFACNVSAGSCVSRGLIPDRATIGFWQNFTQTLTPNNSVSVVVPKKPAVPLGDLALCVTVSYGNLSGPRLVEWLEMQKLLGVSKVMIYNNSIHGPAVHVLDYYQKSGFVDIKSCPQMLTDSFTDHVQREPLMQNDCMYSHLYEYKYFLMSGLDDVIVPLDNNIFTIPDLLNEINHKFTHPSGLALSSYTFKTSHFIVDNKLDPGAENAEFDNSVYPKYKNRTQVVPGHVITIHSSMGCAAVFNHWCAMKANDATPQMDVKTTVGLNFHYRFHICVSGELNSIKDMTCMEKLEHLKWLPLIVDNTINKYSKKLIGNVAGVVLALGH